MSVSISIDAFEYSLQNYKACCTLCFTIALMILCQVHSTLLPHFLGISIVVHVTLFVAPCPNCPPAIKATRLESLSTNSPRVYAFGESVATLTQASTAPSLVFKNTSEFELALTTSVPLPSGPAGVQTTNGDPTGTVPSCDRITRPCFSPNLVGSSLSL